MIRPIVRDPLFLARKSAPAGEDCRQVAIDLADTLRANADRCVGMAANMIGVSRRVIAFFSGPAVVVMLDPEILGSSGEYEAEEGCLSLPGVRKAKRYKKITVRYRDLSLRARTETFEGFTAQIVQHEIDHCKGILI